MKRFAITPLAALGILAGTVPAARAADATCPPTPTFGGTINGNLVVPANARCVVTGDVTVTGNVQVGKGASLIFPPSAGTTVTIGGNVQAAQCQTVSILPDSGAISVGGNVQIQYCTSESGFVTGGLGRITISGNFTCDHNPGGCSAVGGSVRGNVQIDHNSNGGGPGATVVGNNVGGNVRVNNNSGQSAAVVGGNLVGGNLRCVGNSPAPGVTDGGSPNTVAGNKRGQCAGL